MSSNLLYDISLWRFIFAGMIRYIIIMICCQSDISQGICCVLFDISLQRYIAGTIYQPDIKGEHRYLVELLLQCVSFMCDISLKCCCYVARIKRDIQRLSFALLFHNTGQIIITGVNIACERNAMLYNLLFQNKISPLLLCLPRHARKEPLRNWRKDSCSNETKDCRKHKKEKLISSERRVVVSMLPVSLL